MKKNLNILLLFILCLITVACNKDFLDQQPTSALSDQMAFKNMEDVQLALNGCYRQLESPSYYGKDFIIYPEIAADNFKINILTTTGRFVDEYNYTLNSVSGDPTNLWTQGYNVILCANNIILALPSISGGSTQVKNNALGQALAIRALVHFDLVRAFGQPYTLNSSKPGIPIITEKNKNELPLEVQYLKYIHKLPMT